jgi:hypothetical protein
MIAEPRRFFYAGRGKNIGAATKAPALTKK